MIVTPAPAPVIVSGSLNVQIAGGALVFVPAGEAQSVVSGGQLDGVGPGILIGGDDSRAERVVVSVAGGGGHVDGQERPLFEPFQPQRMTIELSRPAR